MRFILCLLLAVLSGACGKILLQRNLCDYGPLYWCQNEQTAFECQRTDYCKLGKTIQKGVTDSSPKPVKIELYYESLCPGCRDFILHQLYPTYKKLFSTGIFTIGLYPYGNAEETQDGDKWKFSCQHGKTECQLNIVESCVLHMLSHPTQFMPFIHCLESSPSMKNAERCADTLKIEWGPIANCYNGSEGNTLEHQMAQKTEALSPQHQYVPWIVVNGKHTEKIQNEAQEDLIDFVCKTYTGTMPHACRVHQRHGQKCYKNERNNKLSF